MKTDKENQSRQGLIKWELTSIIWITLLLSGCWQTQDDIQNRIEEDLADGLSVTTGVSLDLPNLPATKYTAEKNHSSVTFVTGHWEIVNLSGWFSNFDIVMYADSGDFSDAVIYGEVDPLSVWMPNEKMAGSVRRFPYLDSENFGKMSFMSSSFKILDDINYELTGTMTINGIEKEMKFDVIFKGYAYPGEQRICGFEATGQIDRNDFNIGGSDRLHSGRQVHDDIIHLRLSLRME